MPYPHLRIARPVSVLDRSVAMYSAGLGLQELGRFENHDGFDGVMLGLPEASYHFEFTVNRLHPVSPAPTPEDLLVLYIPELAQWQNACAKMLQAGFMQVSAFNPYWEKSGCTFEDHDRYRVVLQRSCWPA